MAEAERKEEAVQGPRVGIVIDFFPTTGKMSFSAPRDPIITLGMLSMAQRETYRIIGEDAVPAVLAPKIQVATQLPPNLTKPG